MTERCVHIIGAGMAGLAAAVRLAGAGERVTVYEAAPGAGGRCRSFIDEKLGRLIDNGNHLLMSGNTSALSYAEEIGARDTFIEPETAAFPFIDLASGARWTIEMDDSPIPLWMLDAERRVPDTQLTDYLSALKVALAGRDKTVADAVKTSGPMYERFWEPLTIAALNAKPKDGAAHLLWAVLRETFLKGGRACRPVIARDGLGPSLVGPALAFLDRHGTDVLFGRRLRAIDFENGRAAALDFAEGKVVLHAGDAVILAVPPSRAAKLIPDLDPPGERGVIFNAHFVLPEKIDTPYAPFIGLINAKSDWIFTRENVASITISAADDMGDEADDVLIPALWREVRAALDLGEASYRGARLIREKRATFDQRPDQVVKRPKTRTAWPNLVLAGDWIDTGLPATIESAVRSGHMAAAAVRRN